VNTALLLDRAATAIPERTAVCLGTQPLHTYRELRDRAAALAAAMTGLGCAPGERVGRLSSSTDCVSWSYVSRSPCCP
jgi:non-ribosomal peptide synthetase component E (peptide arylation enzyme)